MSYGPDPGGIFPSDVHRRVAGHLPLPDDDAISALDLLLRVDADAPTPIMAGEGETAQTALSEVLHTLITGAFAETVGADTYRLSPTGLEALTGPIANEPPPLTGPRLAAAEALDDELAKEAAEDDQRAKEDRLQRAKEELEAAETDLGEDGES